MGEDGDGDCAAWAQLQRTTRLVFGARLASVSLLAVALAAAMRHSCALGRYREFWAGASAAPFPVVGLAAVSAAASGAQQLAVAMPEVCAAHLFWLLGALPLGALSIVAQFAAGEPSDYRTLGYRNRTIGLWRAPRPWARGGAGLELVARACLACQLGDQLEPLRCRLCPAASALGPWSHLAPALPRPPLPSPPVCAPSAASAPTHCLPASPSASPSA
jgi:hypothetical protein